MNFVSSFLYWINNCDLLSNTIKSVVISSRKLYISYMINMIVASHSLRVAFATHLFWFRFRVSFLSSDTQLIHSISYRVNDEASHASCSSVAVPAIAAGRLIMMMMMMMMPLLLLLLIPLALGDTRPILAHVTAGTHSWLVAGATTHTYTHRERLVNRKRQSHLFTCYLLTDRALRPACNLIEFYFCFSSGIWATPCPALLPSPQVTAYLTWAISISF